jgi:2-(1,2-epoxy-1,2-dihydrophenyl)acetyl-CoA isomerase
MSESNHEQTYADMVRERGPLDAFQVVRFEAVDRIATVTLNDPDHLNSYTIRMTGELRVALQRAEDAADVRAVILTGAGKAFSAGGDLRQMRDSDSTPLERHEFIRREFGGLIQQIVAMDKPVIAAVNGLAMGVGLFTALSCDMIIASGQAKFGTAYIHLGLTPLGVSYLLAKTLGYCRAYELCALGDVFDARHAEALGLVNCVVPQECLLDEARKLADRLAAGPPRGLGFVKRLLRRAFHPDLEEHLLLGEAVQPLCLASADHREALVAFAEKRSPHFVGR